MPPSAVALHHNTHLRLPTMSATLSAHQSPLVCQLNHSSCSPHPSPNLISLFLAILTRTHCCIWRYTSSTYGAYPFLHCRYVIRFCGSCSSNCIINHVYTVKLCLLYTFSLEAIYNHDPSPLRSSGCADGNSPVITSLGIVPKSCSQDPFCTVPFPRRRRTEYNLLLLTSQFPHSTKKVFQVSMLIGQSANSSPSTPTMITVPQM